MAAFAAYCQSYARWKEVQEHIDTEGSIFETDKGYQQQTPWVGIANTNQKLHGDGVFVLPDSGEIFVRGECVRYGSDFPKGIGFIIELPGFLKHVSGFNNLKRLAIINRKIDETRIREAMKKVGRLS